LFMMQPKMQWGGNRLSFRDLSILLSHIILSYPKNSVYLQGMENEISRHPATKMPLLTFIENSHFSPSARDPHWV